MDLSHLLVLDSDNNIDVEASCAKFRLHVTKAAEARRHDLDTVSQAVNALYDRFPGAFITIGAIQSMVCSDLKVHPAAYGEISERVHKYMQEWKEAGNGITEAGKPALFVMKKGKGGGWGRRADLKLSAPTA
jgi:hypothetical protein